MAAEKPPQPLRITIGAPQTNNENTLPIQLGIKEGFYKREGIEAQFILIRGVTLVAALLNGDLDYAIYGTTTIRAMATGVPIKVVMSNRSVSGLSLVSGQGVSSVKDLKGRIVAVSTFGSDTEYAARAILSHFGLDPDKEVMLRAVGSGQMTYQSLKAAVTDAGIMSVLEGLQLVREKRGFKILMEVDEVRKGASNNLVVALKKLKEEPGEIKQVIRATLKSIDYLKKNRERVVDYLVKEWRIDRDLALPYYDKVIGGYNSDGRSPDANFQASLREVEERGVVPVDVKIPLSQMRDYSLLAGVLKESAGR